MPPPTLRQHVERARTILSSGGVKTLIPQKGRPAPIRNDAGRRQIEYAIDIKKSVEANDRTGWMLPYLQASDEAANGVWHAIPDKGICLACRVERLHPRNGRRCPRCGKKMATFKGLVSADIRRTKAHLREGGVQVE